MQQFDKLSVFNNILLEFVALYELNTDSCMPIFPLRFHLCKKVRDIGVLSFFPQQLALFVRVKIPSAYPVPFLYKDSLYKDCSRPIVEFWGLVDLPQVLNNIFHLITGGK